MAAAHPLLSEAAGARCWGALAKGRGLELRLCTLEHRGAPCVDLRTWTLTRANDPDSAAPLKDGVRFRLDTLPRVLAALQAIALDAVAAGHLSPEAFHPAALTPSAGTPPRQERAA